MPSHLPLKAFQQKSQGLVYERTGCPTECILTLAADLHFHYEVLLCANKTVGM